MSTEWQPPESKPKLAAFITGTGTFLGLATGCAAIFLGPNPGIFLGAVYPMVGAVLGLWLGKGLLRLLRISPGKHS